MGISRRHFNAALGASIALPSFFARAATDEAHLKELHAAAQKEGELTWYVAHTTSEVAERMSQRFTQRYPGVRVNVVRTTAQVAYQRLNQDMKAGVANCDVFASTDLGHFVDLKQRKALMPYRPQSAALLDKRFQDIDPDAAYNVTGSNLISMLYNTARVPAEKAPRSWKALTDPAWKGQLSVGHPGFSGFVGTWLVQMVELYGEDFIEALAANQPQVGRSIIDTVTTVISGERVASAGPVSLALMQKSRGNPIDVSYVDEGCVLMVLPSAIMANTQRPNAAKLWMEWAVSEDTARISTEEFNSPVLAGFPPREGVRPLSEIKTIQPTVKQIIEGVPELTEVWRDAFGV